MNIGVSPRNGVRQTFLPVYLQQQQHKVLRVTLERRLGSPSGSAGTETQAAQTAKNAVAFFFYFFFFNTTQMENTPDLGDEMDLFFSTEKSFQYLGITPAAKTAPFAWKAAFILFHFNAEVRNQ